MRSALSTAVWATSLSARASAPDEALMFCLAAQTSSTRPSEAADLARRRAGKFSRTTGHCWARKAGWPLKIHRDFLPALASGQPGWQYCTYFSTSTTVSARMTKRLEGAQPRRLSAPAVLQKGQRRCFALSKLCWNTFSGSHISRSLLEKYEA